MRNKTRLALWILILIGAASSLKVAAGRWRVESANKRVEIVLDWDELRSLADTSNAPITEVLRRFYLAGARGVAVTEQTLGALEAQKRVEVVPVEGAHARRGSRRSPAAPEPSTPAEMTTVLRIPDGALRARVEATIQRKWGAPVTEDGDTIAVRAAWPELSGLGVGFADDVLLILRTAHLEPVLRPFNYLGASPANITATAEALKIAGGRLLIFAGDQVMGYPGTVKEMAKVLPANGLEFGQIEFGKQKGEENLAADLKGDFVRVHSINPVEMSRMGPADAVDRFLRAAQERNIRCLYIRMLPGAPSPPVGENVAYINAIAGALQHNRPKLRLDLAVPFRPYDSHPIGRCAIGVGVAAATLLIGTYVWPVSGIALLALLALAALDVVLPATGFGRKLVALQGALLYPVLAFLVLRLTLEKAHGMREPDPQPLAGSLAVAVLRAVPLYLCTSLISLLGAVSVVGLLSSRLGTMKVVEFSGIKAQQAGAILIVLAVFALDISSRGGLRAARARVRARAVALWNQPLLLGGLFVGLVSIVALAFLLARSGNDPGVGVSPMELHFRAVLDKLLGVRPRTKEFLIGNPALLLGIGLAMLRRPRFAVPMLVVGAIGQVSLVNTFCHLHTPLVISALRIINGLWTGVVMAAVYAFAVDRVGKGQRAQGYQR